MNPYTDDDKTNIKKITPKSIGVSTRGFKIGVTKWFRQNTDIYTVCNIIIVDGDRRGDPLVAPTRVASGILSSTIPKIGPGINIIFPAQTI